jgi:hypothetical protein
MTTQPNPNAAALMGALVADAATLGTHWIYDPARIGKIANNSPAFVPINAQNYDGVPAYFAHAARKNGDQSQYGEVLALAIRCITTNDGFDVTGYQDAFVAHFGAGGAYQGYIDRPTRGALDNISADQRAPSGTDDDQHPAIATLPALVARYRGSDDFADHITAAVHITNVNEAADHYAGIFADLLADVLSGTDLQHALRLSANRFCKPRSIPARPTASLTAKSRADPVISTKACRWRSTSSPIQIATIGRSRLTSSRAATIAAAL